MRQARSRYLRRYLRVAVTTLRRPPHRARGGHDLLIRRYPRGRPDPFRSVHDLGLVSVGCPGGSGASEGCSSVWLPVWLPAAPPRGSPMVFKTIRGSRSATAAACVVGVRGWFAEQDHPAYIPRLGYRAQSVTSYALRACCMAALAVRSVRCPARGRTSRPAPWPPGVPSPACQAGRCPRSRR
jgi:hypothetical protein